MTNIHQARGQKVILDSDLAELYGVETRVLNQAVTRNKDRFPDDFMFELSPGERATLLPGRARRVFTVGGVLMLANILKSQQAAAISRYVIEATTMMQAEPFQQITNRKKKSKQ